MSNTKGPVDYGTLKRELLSFNSVIVETNTVSANDTTLFEVSEEEDIISNLDFTPEDRDLPKYGRLVAIRVNVVSGSTDTTLSIYEGEDGNAIDQTAQIQNLDTSSSPESFTLGGDSGFPFVNQEDENTLHLEIDELSGSNSEYEIKLIWSNVGIKTIDALSLQ